MSDITNSASTEEEDKKNISSLVKEVSAFFHREMKKQQKDDIPLSHFKERISRENISSKADVVKDEDGLT